MNNYSKYWDKKLPDNLTKSTYSIWLDNFIKEFSNNNLPILDLGCGNGDDTKWLVENKFNVVSSDFSLSSIEYVKKINPNTILLDMSKLEDWKNLEDNTYSAIIANLSLHYFNNDTTIMILKELKRILIPNGTLIARVNTNLDTEFGAGDGIEIEPNFYQNLERGIDKRFFTEESAQQYFSIIGNPTITLKTIQYIGKQKQIFEIVVKNEKNN